MKEMYKRECEILTEHLTEVVNLCYTYRDKLINLGHKNFIIKNEIPKIGEANE